MVDITGNGHKKSDINMEIMYFVTKNLYGFAMSEYLIYDDFKCNDKVSVEKILKRKDYAENGYAFKVHLEYSESEKKL